MTRYMTITDVENGFEVFDLPDEWTDVHVTIANGTITAVPMRRVGVVTDYDPFPYSWVDAPGETPA